MALLKVNIPLNSKYKSAKTIIDHCRYIYARCNIYDKAILHKWVMYTKASLNYNDGNIHQKARYERYSSMFEKANPECSITD